MMTRKMMNSVVIAGALVALFQIDHRSPSVTASVVDGESTITIDCAATDAAGARLNNGSLIILGEPLVGVTQNADFVVSMSAVYCFEAAPSQTGCSFNCGDLNGDAEFDLADFGIFQQCFDAEPAGICQCADLNIDASIDLIDFGLFVASHNDESGGVPPDCP